MSSVGNSSESFVRTRPDDYGEISRRFSGANGRMPQKGGRPSTLHRLFVSQHVKDLQLIVVLALALVVLVCAIGVRLAHTDEEAHATNQARPGISAVFSAERYFWAFFTPVLGVFGAVLAWAYQVGSARLGVVDLFACEISTLCRVAAVTDSMDQSIKNFENGFEIRNGAGHFTSQENYFPVFENSTRDLQALDAQVVINITEFYTYMKAARDRRRAQMEIFATPIEPAPQAGEAGKLTPWQEEARNAIYMTFLGLESARNAIGDLVDFRPDRAEDTIEILYSELKAYRFLCAKYADKGEIRHELLVLREPAYRRIVKDLRENVGKEARKASDPSQWDRALILANRLSDDFGSVMSGALQPVDVPQPASADAVSASNAALEPVNLPASSAAPVLTSA